MLAAGLVLLLLAVGLSEYSRRHPRARSEDAAPVAAAVTAASPLLEAEAPRADDGAGAPEAVAALLESKGGTAAPGFSPVVHGAFAARQLRSAFGAVLFLADVGGGSALVRAAAGEGARVVAARKARVDALYLDGSAAFFAQGGVVLSTGARGDEPVEVRVRFKRAVVTSLAAVGDTVYVALQPAGQSEASDEATGAVARVERDGQVALVAAKQVRPRALVADGKDVFWVAGRAPALWRSPRDGSYASQLAPDAEGPVAIDGDGLLYRGADGGLWRVPRAGGAPVVVAPPGVKDFVAMSGLVRFTTAAGLLEVTPGAEPRSLLATTAAPLGVALAGASLYVLTGAPGATALLAQ
jgi:hypothetical protein